MKAIDYIGSTAKSQFSYDGLGHRMVDVETASGGGTTTRYLWCGPFICQTRDGSDNILRRDLAEGEYNATTNQKLVYMPDQLGSVRDVLDASSGSLVQSYNYSPYGTVVQSNGSTPVDYQFAWLFLHPVSALSISTTRATETTSGTWLQRDPIREKGGINLYGYVGAAPIGSNDPQGLAKCTCIPPMYGIRQPNSEEKLCSYSCTCTECSGTTRTFEITYSAGTSESAECLGTYTYTYGGFAPTATRTHYHTFSFDTNSPLDRIINSTPNGFMNEINHRCGCTKTKDNG
jgi:RHS repeat-associated protein